MLITLITYTYFLLSIRTWNNSSVSDTKTPYTYLHAHIASAIARYRQHTVMTFDKQPMTRPSLQRAFANFPTLECLPDLLPPCCPIDRLPSPPFSSLPLLLPPFVFSALASISTLSSPDLPDLECD